MRNYSMKNMIWNNKGHQLDDYANIILKERNKYHVVGNSNEIEDFYKRIGKYLENNKLEYLGEDEVIIDNDTCIICTFRDRERYDKEREKWEKMGFVENERFFQAEVFAMVYEVYKLNRISIDRVEVFLTSCCTLNCEKCISYIPYFKKPNITPVEKLKQDADILFSKVDYVYKIKLLGGEVLLYPFLEEYIDYLYDNYREKIGSIRIGTNGTIFPTQAIIEMCKRDHVIVDISDYTQAVPQLCLLDEVKKLCESNGVSVDVKRTGEQWLDLGFPNNIPEPRSEEELREHFFKCAMFCRQFRDGKMYYCCSNFAAVLVGLFEENSDDYFDFAQEFDKKELLEYELGYNRLGHTTFCNVCRGCSDEANPLHVEVAKQINRF